MQYFFKFDFKEFISPKILREYLNYLLKKS